MKAKKKQKKNKKKKNKKLKKIKENKKTINDYEILKGKRITAKKDYVFKSIFLDPNTKSIMEKYLSEKFGTDIIITEYLNNELAKDSVYAVGKRVDLVVRTNIGIINVEVNGSSYYSHDRNYSYISQIYSNYVKSGEKYELGLKAYQLNLTYGCLNKYPFDEDKYAMQSPRFVYSDKVTIIEENMDKYMDLWYTRNIKGTDVIEEIKKHKYDIMFDLTIPELEELYEITKDKEVYNFMEKFKSVSDEQNFLEYASLEEEIAEKNKISYANGINEGIEEGRVKGIEEGRVKGIEEGIDERNTEIATQMINDGFDLNTISKYSTLSLDELSKIKENIPSKSHVLA